MASMKAFKNSPDIPGVREEIHMTRYSSAVKAYFVIVTKKMARLLRVCYQVRKERRWMQPGTGQVITHVFALVSLGGTNGDGQSTS